MITFLLYVITAISTAWQLSQQILMGVWGKPSNPFEFIGFFGSIILLASAYVALFSLRRANWTIEQEGNRAIAKMTFEKLEGFNYIETDSKEVIAYLQKNNPHDVVIRVSLTYDFGKVRSLNLNYAYLGNIKFVPNIDTNP